MSFESCLQASVAIFPSPRACIGGSSGFFRGRSFNNLRSNNFPRLNRNLWISRTFHLVCHLVRGMPVQKLQFKNSSPGYKRLFVYVIAFRLRSRHVQWCTHTRINFVSRILISIPLVTIPIRQYGHTPMLYRSSVTTRISDHGSDENRIKLINTNIKSKKK